MAGNTLDLLIQARADFGNAQSQIRNLHTLLKGLDQSTPGGLISLPPDTMKNIEALQKALAKAGMAGKALKEIQFPEGKFRAAAAQVEQMRRNFEQIQKTDLGRQVRQMAQSAGQDTSNPLGWNWKNMTRGMQAQDATILRNAFRNSLYQVHGTPPGSGGGGSEGPGGHGGGRDWGGMGGRVGAWMGNSIGGSILRTGGMLSSLAVGGGVMGAMFAGYRENQQTLEGVDAIFKSIGGNVGGFSALKDQVTELGSALQITGSAASELAASFVRTSGANDMQALERAQAAGQFGRGLGMDPGASAQLFGRAGLIGVGNTRQTQRDFASLMGKTIADSGMFARSEQVMEGMVGQLERIASTQGRTASAGEMQSISAILGDLLKSPALRGGGAESVMGVAQRLGNGSDLAMAMMAYEGVTGGDLGKTLEIAYSDAMTPIGQLRGFEGTGITDTRADYMVRNVRRLSQGTGLDEGQFAANYFGVNPELYRQYAQTFDGKRLAEDDSGFRSWMGQMGLDPNQVNMGGIGTLADIYKNQGAAPGSAHINRLVSLAEEYRTNGQLKDQPELLEALNKASDPQQLQAVMAKIVGTVGAPKTEADLARQAQADLTTALGQVGEAINKLIPAIQNDLAPWVKKAAEYLRDIIDFFTADTEKQAAIKDQRQRDNRTMENWRELGWVDNEGHQTEQFGSDPWARDQYERIARERGIRRPATPTGTGAAADGTSVPNGQQPAYKSWNVAPPQAGNSGVTGSSATLAAQAALDPNAPGRNVLLDMIAAPESGGHYNAMYKAAGQTDIDLTGMTMDEIDALQTRMINERGGSAIGRYQYVQDTLRGLRKDMGIGGSEKFTPELQDRLATESMRRRGLLDWEAGTLPDADFQFNLSQEWAGLPKDASGLSYHHGFNGNRANLSHGRMQGYFSDARAARSATSAAPAAPVAAEPAVAPAPPVAAEPAVAPAPPVAAEPATAPAAPVAAEPALAPAPPVQPGTEGALASGRQQTWNNGQPIGWHGDVMDPRYSADNIGKMAQELGILRDEAYNRLEAEDLKNPNNLVPKATDQGVTATPSTTVSDTPAQGAPNAPEVPQHAQDLAVLAPRLGDNGPRQQVLPTTTINSEEAKAGLTPEQRARLDETLKAAEARDAAAKAAGKPAYDGIRDFGNRNGMGAMPDPMASPPPTPDPVVSMTNPTAANARVDGQVSVNINVAKDGKPVSESFRALSFGEPRVPGSGGTMPKNNRVEWSNTV